MGPGGDGGSGSVRMRDGFDGLPDRGQPQQPGGAGQTQDAERQRVLDTLDVPNRIGGVNDGFGSFAPQPERPKPDKPDKSNAFFVAVKWFTDGIMATISAVLTKLHLFNPTETFEMSAVTYYDERITAASDGAITEWVPAEAPAAEEVADTIVDGGLESADLGLVCAEVMVEGSFVF